MNGRRVGPSAVQQFLLVVSVWALFLALLLAAPAPLPRREVPTPVPHPPRACVMTWGSSKWECEFRRDGYKQGTYRAIRHDQAWEGTWSLSMDMHGRLILHVKERLGEGGWIEWAVLLREAMTLDGSKTIGGEIPVQLDWWTPRGVDT